MKTIREICEKTKVSARTLRYYDKIGLLRPTEVTDAGYRLYDDAAADMLVLIRIYRELGFSLKQIASLLTATDAERNRALEEQIGLLEEKNRKLQNRIVLARGLQGIGVKGLNTENFNVDKIDERVEQAKTLWGKTDAYKEFEQKSAGRSKEDEQALGEGLMDLFAKLGKMRDKDPGSAEARRWVAELRDYISEHYYSCTPQILRGLGQMYAGGGEMTENIDRAGGEGTGAYAKRAIDAYCEAVGKNGEK